MVYRKRESGGGMQEAGYAALSRPTLANHFHNGILRDIALLSDKGSLVRRDAQLFDGVIRVPHSLGPRTSERAATQSRT